MKTLLILTLAAHLHIFSKVCVAGDIQIEFTSDDSYSTEVAYIQIGDTIEWLPTNEGHNVEFLSGPEGNSLPKKSKIDEPHSVVFTVPGVYLYGCTPHANMGMLGLIIVGNDLHNLESIKNVELTPVATSVLMRLVKTAQWHIKIP